VGVATVAIDRLKIGRARELEVAEIMHKKRYLETWWQPPRSKYDTQDIFSLFDLVGIMPSGAMIMVQVKKLRFDDDTKTRIEAFVRAYKPACHMFMAYYDARPGQPVRRLRLEALGWDDMTWYCAEDCKCL
jgi:hypothetical protein